MPEREEDHLTPATRLMEKRREMAEVESSLLAEKEVKKKEKKTFEIIVIIYFTSISIGVSNENGKFASTT
jgi:hypothetical protein